MAQRVKMDTDVVIIGGGPAGCTLAKELSKRGKRVILLEKGRDDDRFLGGGLGVFLRLEKGPHFPLPLKQTQQGDTVILAKCLGGGTVLYAGAAGRPDLGYWKRYGIELDQDLIAEAEKECCVALPPEEYIGPGTRRIWEAADALGLPFERQYRHVDFSKCRPGCEYCCNGCLRGAKWTAREFAREAIENGATVLSRTRATDIVIEDGVARGVEARGRNGRCYEIEAKAVACCAGGTHTARLLQRCGFPEAGSWFTGDPTFFTFGFVNEGPNNTGEHSMTVGWHDEEHKVLFCSMVSPKGSWHTQLVQDERLRGLLKLRHYRRTLGVFAKVSDDGAGRIASNGQISKTFTEQDHGRFEYARDVNTRVLVKAGCDPNDIHHSGFVMGHPGGTVRVGELLDSNLQTRVENLYSCDTGVFPEAPGIPPALTIVVLAKRLARRLESTI